MIFTTFTLSIYCSRNRLKPCCGHKLPLSWKHKIEERMDTWLEGHRKDIFFCNVTITFACFMLISLLAHTEENIRAKQKMVLLGKSTTAHTCSSHIIICWFAKGKALREKSTKQAIITSLEEASVSSPYTCSHRMMGWEEETPLHTTCFTLLAFAKLLQ